MWRGAAQPQTEAAKPPKGRADLRAPERSADDRREAEAPKEKKLIITVKDKVIENIRLAGGGLLLALTEL